MLEAMLAWAKKPEHRGRAFRVKLKVDGEELPPMTVVDHGPGWVATIVKDGDMRLYLNEANVSAACIEWAE
jgi:hypothetical protein